MTWLLPGRKKKLTHSSELSLASLVPCVRKVCYCVTDSLFTRAILLIQCLFDSRSAPQVD